MNVNDAIRDALSRLSTALDRLDAAALRHADGGRARATLEAELSLMRQDRHDLARKLDSEKAAKQQLELGLDELAPRIDRAIAVVRSSMAGG